MAVSRPLVLLAIGFLAGLVFVALRSMVPSGALMKLPRAYTTIIRSKQGGSSQPTRGKQTSSGQLRKDADAAPAKPATEAAEAAPAEEAPRKKPKLQKRVTQSSDSGAKAAAPAAVDNDKKAPPKKRAPAIPGSKEAYMKTAESKLPDICQDTERFPEDPVDWHIVTRDEIETDEDDHCYLANVTHWSLAYYHKLEPYKICTHDPEVDTVISSHLHKWQFWGGAEEFHVLMNSGEEGDICTSQRPYMLDIGANIGLFTLLGAARGCRVLAFEPLNDNMHRLGQSLIANGWWDSVLLFQHAVGKYFTEVVIGFRPSNPGSSGINLGGSKSETRQQITIDGLLLGKNPPKFKDAGAKDLPPILGEHINFVKVDTEGYDVAVVAGMLRTFITGKVPLMLIEFGPMDASGTAGCDPAAFVQTLYDAGYAMWDYHKRVELPVFMDELLPAALNGTGRRVFEAFFVRDDFADKISKQGKLLTGN